MVLSEVWCEAKLTTKLTQRRKEKRAAYHHHRARRYETAKPPLRTRRLPGPRRLCKKHDHRCCEMDGARPGCIRCRRPMPQTREHILCPARLACLTSSCSCNKCDMVDDEELLELVEMEVRECFQVRLPRRRTVPFHQGSGCIGG